jgi:hypothetical protein
VGDDAHYPEAIQTAEARIATEHEAPAVMVESEVRRRYLVRL